MATSPDLWISSLTYEQFTMRDRIEKPPMSTQKAILAPDMSCRNSWIRAAEFFISNWSFGIWQRTVVSHKYAKNSCFKHFLWNCVLAVIFSFWCYCCYGISRNDIMIEKWLLYLVCVNTMWAGSLWTEENFKRNIMSVMQSQTVQANHSWGPPHEMQMAC